MEHLFNYTIKLSSEINSLIEDMAVLQKILKTKKNSFLTEEKLKNTEKEIKKKLFFLRILEHVSYLENYKIDIQRAISSIETFLEKKTFHKEERKKISYYLSSIGVTYQEEIAEEKSIAPLSLQHQTIEKLDETMKIIEEILLSFYGLTSPVENLEEKLIKSVENLFSLKLENLAMEEKLLIEEFFNQIQQAFKENSVEEWEKAFIKCTEVLNELKKLAGLEPNSSLNISIESIDIDEKNQNISFDSFDDDKNGEEENEEEKNEDDK